MLSKRSKISGVLLSIGILAFLATSALATNYHHQHYLSAHHNLPGLVPIEFELGVQLDVTTGEGDLGLIITGQSGSYDFDYRVTWIIWPFWALWWTFAPNVQWSYQYNWAHEKISVKYRVWGTVYRSDGSCSVCISVWVKIDAYGGKTQGTDVWNDGTGLVFLDHYYPVM